MTDSTQPERAASNTPPEAERWDLDAMQASFGQMALRPEQTITFTVNRSPEAVARDGPDKTFSQDAVDKLLMQMRAWMYSRLYRQKGTQPRKMNVTVSVRFDEP